MASEDTDHVIGEASQFSFPEYLTSHSALKPKLDAIFSEVEANLPTINFEASDVSSDEDVAIFQRSNVKTPTFDDDKDFDEMEDLFNNEEKKENSGTEMVNSLLQSCSLMEEMLEKSSKEKNSSYDVMSEIQPGSIRYEAINVMANQTPDRSSSSRQDDINLTSQNTGTSTRSMATSTDDMVEIMNENISQRHRRRINSNEDCETEITTLERDMCCQVDMDESDDGINKELEDIMNGMVPSEGENASGPKSKQDPEALVSQYFSAEGATLGFNVLDRIPLDLMSSAAENTKSMKEFSNLDMPHFHSPRGRPPDSGDANPEEVSIIQKLAKISLSGNDCKDLDPKTGAVRSKQTGLKGVKTRENIIVEAQNKQTSPLMMTGVTNKADLENLPKVPTPPSPKVKDSRETVFIDLRNFDKNKADEELSFEAVQRILRIQKHQGIISDSSDDSGSEGEQEVMLWHQQRKKAKEAIMMGKTPDVIKEKPIEKPKIVTPKDHVAPQRLARPLPKAKPETNVEEEKVRVQDQEGSGEPAKQSPKEIAAEKEKKRRLEAARKMREQKENERQTRLRLQRQLDAMRPETSSRGRHSPAEATPTVYDMDASYEPSPASLPGDIPPDIEATLLTIHLTSNGEIRIHRGSKSVDQGTGLSATYTTLLTYFLSLVPNNFDFLQSMPKDNVMTPAPFHVVGLQQMFMEDELCLFVAVTPVETFTAKDAPGKGKKSKKKDEIKDSTPFRQIINKFFTTNTLHTVCPWLMDMVSLDVTSAKQEEQNTQNAFTYKPPLPNITTRPLSTFIQINPDKKAVYKVFGCPVGFFWETVENEEMFFDQNLNNEDVDYETQNTMSLVYKKVYREPRAMMGILNRILQEGLDLSGVRLVFPTPELMNVAEGKPSNVSVSSEQVSNTEMLNSIGPILAMAIRGTFARTFWLDAVGPADPQLARRTDPNSLCALYGGKSREECLLFCPRNPSRISTELVRWFGGRVPANGVIDVGCRVKKEFSSPLMRKTKKVCFADSPEDVDLDIPSNRPPATLTATTKSDVFLVLSPLIPPKCMGLLLASCQRRGYQLHGIRRVKLSNKRANLLGIAPNITSIYSNSDENVPMGTKSLLKRNVPCLHNPSTILLLHKENAFHHAASLIEYFMIQLALQDILGNLQKSIIEPLTSSHVFHAAFYTDSILSGMGGDFSKVPDCDLSVTPGFIQPKLHSNPEMEQIVVLTLTGHTQMKTFGILLGKLQNLNPYSKTQPINPIQEGFELIGIKWLPGLSMQHAKEVTPFEVGDKQWKSSIHTLTSEPAVVLVLRGINAFKRLEAVITPKSSTYYLGQKVITLDKLMSLTPELAFCQATLFFKNSELFADPTVRSLLPYLPPVRPPPTSSSDMDESVSRSKKNKSPKFASLNTPFMEESILKTMTSGPRLITTVVILKPDAVKKHLGKFLSKATREGFRIVGLRLETLTAEICQHFIPDEDKDNDVLSQMHIDYLTSAPSIVLCLQRENAVKKLVDLLGPLDPQVARRQSQFLWRATFGVDPIVNGLHGSKTYLDAVKEQKLLFPKGLCCEPVEDLMAENILCPGEDPWIDLSISRNIKERTKEEIEKTLENYKGSKSKNSGTGSNLLTVHVSALTQTNCLVLTPLLLRPEGKSKVVPFVEILDYLLQHGFELVGCRMLWFTTQQAEKYLHLCNAGNFSWVPVLTSGASIVLALQRDNAVMGIEALLGSSFDKDSILMRYGEKIMRSKDIKQAQRILGYFFESLSPNAHYQINQDK